MSKYYYIVLAIICGLVLSFCSEVNLAQKRTGAYLSETPPDTTAKLFAPGFITTGFHTRDIAISLDGNEYIFA